jgi:hypothetical protein
MSSTWQSREEGEMGPFISQARRNKNNIHEHYCEDEAKIISNHRTISFNFCVFFLNYLWIKIISWFFAQLRERGMS